MRFEVRLVHAEAGRRVVLVSALTGETSLGSALGEAEHAEEAEDRALQRLCRRLGAEATEASGTGAAPGSPGESTRAARNAAQRGHPAGPAAATRTGSAMQSEPHSETCSVANAVSPAAASPAPMAGRPSALTVGVDPGQPLRSLASAPGSTPAETEAPHNELAPGDRASDHDEPAGRDDRGSDPPAAEPEDWSDELTRLDLSLRRIGWGRDQEGEYLRRAFGHPSRSRITEYGDLLAYLRMLESLEPGADPTLAAVPLRRRDLLDQSDQLLSRLGWDDGQARRFTSEHLGARSRRQLSDTQLLQFNMLLEAELIAASKEADLGLGGLEPATA